MVVEGTAEHNNHLMTVHTQHIKCLQQSLRDLLAEIQQHLSDIHPEQNDVAFDQDVSSESEDLDETHFCKNTGFYDDSEEEELAPADETTLDNEEEPDVVSSNFLNASSLSQEQPHWDYEFPAGKIVPV